MEQDPSERNTSPSPLSQNPRPGPCVMSSAAFRLWSISMRSCQFFVEQTSLNIRHTTVTFKRSTRGGQLFTTPEGYHQRTDNASQRPYISQILSSRRLILSPNLRVYPLSVILEGERDKISGKLRLLLTPLTFHYANDVPFPSLFNNMTPAQAIALYRRPDHRMALEGIQMIVP